MMFNFKKLLAVFFCGLFLMQASKAVTLPYTNRVGSAISALIAGKTAERVTGVAMSALPPAGISSAVASQTADPAYQKTIQVASFVTTGILSAAIAAGTLPIWATVALGTAAAVAVPLALNGLVQWWINTPPATPLTTTTATTNTGVAAVLIYDVGVPIRMDDVALTTGAVQYFQRSAIGGPWYSFWQQSTKAYTNPNVTLFSTGLYLTWVVSGTTYYIWKSATTSSTTSPSCPVNYSKAGTGCVASGTTNVVLPNQTVQQGVDALPKTELDKPVNPQLLADLANKLWKAASASPGTVPYDATKPITAADVLALKASLDSLNGAINSIPYPTVGDMVGPGVSPDVGTPVLPYTPSTIAPPKGLDGTITTTQTTTDSAGNKTTSSSSSLIDWGVFTPPDLVSPSIESILDPIFNLWPAWKNFSFPSHASACPAPSFTLPASIMNGRTFTFDSFCVWIDQIRGPMQAAFAVAWSVAIIFVVMGA